MADFDEDKEHISEALQRQPDSYSFTLLSTPRGSTWGTGSRCGRGGCGQGGG